MHADHPQAAVVSTPPCAAAGSAPWPLLGVDFSSAPSRRKPIVVAQGMRDRSRVVLQDIWRLDSLGSFSAWLQGQARWLGGFDLPFGLPRELVLTLGWPTGWLDCMRHYCALDRAAIRQAFSAFCDARPAGSKFAHRACDRPAGSSPSMKWVNPPVAFMMHAGVPILLQSGATLAGVHVGRSDRMALEAYPGLLARELLGSRSYKSDERARQTAERLIARKDLVDALEQGRSRLGLRIVLSHAQREALVDDAGGDTLDAALCMMQAAWAEGRPRWGLPADMDGLEGWIVTS